MEEKVQAFIDKMEIVRRWLYKVTNCDDSPISDESIVILLDTLGAI